MRNPEDYKKIIFGMAFKFSPNKQDFEDWVGEALVCFVEIANEEKIKGLCCPFEAALSSRIRQVFLTNILEKSKAKKRMVDHVSLSDLEEILGRNPWRRIEEYLSLSKEMREVADVILNAPQEFIDLIRIEDFKTGLSKYLRKYKGWSLKNVNQFWEEFKLKENERG